MHIYTGFSTATSSGDFMVDTVNAGNAGVSGSMYLTTGEPNAFKDV